MSSRGETVCRSKRRFKTERGARFAAQEIKAGTGDRLRPYKCPFCKRYHLTTSDLPPEAGRGTRKGER